jgi:hypothetical protein
MAVDLVAMLGDVRSVTVRDVAGDGHQAELLIQTKRGAVALRLVGWRPLRLVDLRRRDKRARGRGRLVDVPMHAPTAAS